MARLLGPDAGSRLAYLEEGMPAVNAIAVVYANSGGTVLADIRTYDGSETPGEVIVGSQVSTDGYGQLPLFWFPDDVDRVWVKVGSDGPVWPVDADNNRRLDQVVDASGALVVGSQGAFSDAPTWGTGRAYRDGNKDGIVYVKGWTDASGAESPLTYSKLFGGHVTKTGPGNHDSFWASVQHYGAGEAGLFIGDVRAPEGAAGGNLWGGHFQLVADVPASMRGLHIDLQPNVSVVGKQTIGLHVSNNSATNRVQQGVRVNGQFDNPIICYSDAAGTVPVFYVTTDGDVQAAGRVFIGAGSPRPFIASGSGTPEGVLSAPSGSLFLRSDGEHGTRLYVKQTGTGNTGWLAQGVNIVDFLWNGNATYRESFPRVLGGAGLTITSGVAYLVGVPLFKGDVVTNITAASGSTALTRGTTAGTAHLWFALYSPSMSLLGQSADEGDAAAWAGNAVKTKALTAPYVVPTNGVYYAAVMVNAGAGGTPAVNTLRGLSSGPPLQGGMISGQRPLGGSNGTGLTGTAPSGPLTLSQTGILPYVVLS